MDGNEKKRSLKGDAKIISDLTVQCSSKGEGERARKRECVRGGREKKSVCVCVCVLQVERERVSLG